MSSLPTLVPTRAAAETFGGVTYHIDGELVSAPSVDATNLPACFDHQILVNRFTGPARVGIQSMYLHMPSEG